MLFFIRGKTIPHSYQLSKKISSQPVPDISTYEILFVNKYTEELYGDITGSICWKKLQKDGMSEDICKGAEDTIQ